MAPVATLACAIRFLARAFRLTHLAREGTIMRTVTMAGLAAVSLTAGLALTACGTASSAGSSSPATGAGAGASTAASVPGASPSGGTVSSPSPGSGSGSPGASGTPNCQAPDLKMTIGISDPSEHFIPFNLRNAGPQACHMAGFPGVNVVGQTAGSGEQKTFSLARGGQGYSTVTIAPGQYAQFTLSFKPTSVAALTFFPRSLVVTPPDTYSSLTFPLSTFDGTKLTFTLSQKGGLDPTAEHVSPVGTGPGDPQPGS